MQIVTANNIYLEIAPQFEWLSQTLYSNFEANGKNVLNIYFVYSSELQKNARWISVCLRSFFAVVYSEAY